MTGRLKICAVFAALVMMVSACGALNPFVGKWKSGIMQLEFKADKSFKLVIGQTISVNLEGDYSYDDDTLTLSVEGGSNVIFTYTFKEGKKELVLTPETDFEYIRTEIELTKQ